MKRFLLILILLVFSGNYLNARHCYDYILLDGSEPLVTFGMDTTDHWWAITSPFSGEYRLTIDGISSEVYKEIKELKFSPDGHR